MRASSALAFPLALSSACPKKVITLKLAVSLGALVLLGGSISGHAQSKTKLVPHVSIMQRSTTPPGSLQMHNSTLRTMRTNRSPVNTGSGVVYTCDASVATATCNYLNTTVAGYYNATFTNANANIYIQYGSTGLGASLQAENFATYSQYSTAYGNVTNKSAIQVSAQSALSTYDATPYGSDYVDLTAALATALGFTGASGVTTASGHMRSSAAVDATTLSSRLPTARKLHFTMTILAEPSRQARTTSTQWCNTRLTKCSEHHRA